MTDELDKQKVIAIIQGLTQHFIDEHITSEKEQELLIDFSENLLANIEDIENIEAIDG